MIVAKEIGERGARGSTSRVSDSNERGLSEGVSAKNVTLSVPRLRDPPSKRLREIINAAKKIKTPSLSVYLKPKVNKTKEKAKNVHCALEYTTLRSVTQATEVWYDLDPMSTIIETHVDFVKSYYEMPDKEVEPDKISPWLLWIELNRKMMIDKKLNMADIAEKINQEFDDDLTLIDALITVGANKYKKTSNRIYKELKHLQQSLMHKEDAYIQYTCIFSPWNKDDEGLYND
ncbi:hypothetical protein GIB67_009083 [Kingdonia uniflora]|uniref:DNA-directed RNA polymerase n=1 Tax=Kingdonia uniflora TaxID=39325 RepID=A0A7J7MN88_9MAGN|nr:hypothetical protein GIB67_009083 [Kingdonia uniflora]